MRHAHRVVASLSLTAALVASCTASDETAGPAAGSTSTGGTGGAAGSTSTGGTGGAAGSAGAGGAAGAAGSAGAGGTGVPSIVDLREYFPASGKNTLNNAAGLYVHDYTFYPATSSFQSLYDSLLSLGKPGQVHVWQKDYRDSQGCVGTYTPDYGILFFGDDGSVTEVGDWVYAENICQATTAFGYHDATKGVPSGLSWCPAGGLTATSSGVSMGLQVWRQNQSGGAFANTGFTAYNLTSLAGVLASFSPAYGSSGGAWHAGGGKTYHDVARLLFYHGPGGPGLSDVTCTNLDPSWPYAALYHHQPGYQSYALEFYMAKGVGIVQESLLYTESAYFGASYVCAGGVSMGTTQQAHDAQMALWAWYIDDP